MESQSHQQTVSNGGESGGVKPEKPSRRLFWYQFQLRFMALALTLAAAMVSRFNRETQTISLKVVETLPPLQLTFTAKWSDMSSTVYFVVSNFIACLYSAASLMLVSLSNINGATKMAVYTMDLTMVALLFSANGATEAIGFIALNGNSHVQWHKVCHLFKKYCNQGKASVVLSMIGSLVFLWLVLLTTYNVHRRSST